MINHDFLTVELSSGSMNIISVDLEEPKVLNVELENLGSGVLDKYEGSYEVIPKVISQSLPTKNKNLIDDISVEAIPYYEVRNPKGDTVIIG